MDSLTKKEIEAEIKAVENVLNIHKVNIDLNQKGVKANSFILELLQKELGRIICAEKKN